MHIDDRRFCNTLHTTTQFLPTAEDRSGISFHHRPLNGCQVALGLLPPLRFRGPAGLAAAESSSVAVAAPPAPSLAVVDALPSDSLAVADFWASAECAAAPPLSLDDEDDGAVVAGAARWLERLIHITDIAA
jgi:hypothetical protein